MNDKTAHIYCSSAVLLLTNHSAFILTFSQSHRRSNITIDCDGCMQLLHCLLQRAGSLAVAPQQTSTMLLQLDGGILLLALSSLFDICFSGLQLAS